MTKVNVWTQENVAKLEAGYVPQDMGSVEALAEELKVSKRSVIGKLVHLNLYVAPEKPAKAKKDEGPTKGEILTAIANQGFDVDGFEAANKQALIRLKAFVGAKAGQ